MKSLTTNQFRLFVFFIILITSPKTIAQEPDNEDDFRVSKGRYFGTFTFSLDHRDAENENQLLRYVIDQDRLNYRLIGSSGYAISDNLTLGLGLGYGRQREDITYEDENGNEITSRRIQQGMSVSPTFRNYVPLGSGKLQILVQTELNLTFGESLQRNFFSNEIDKIEGGFFEASLGVSPGVVLFFDRNWAFETTVGLAGLTTRIEEEVVNGDEENKTRVVESGVDLRINLLQLNLGIAYYF